MDKFQDFVFMCLGIVVLLLIGIYAELKKITNGIWNQAYGSSMLVFPDQKENPSHTRHDDK